MTGTVKQVIYGVRAVATNPDLWTVDDLTACFDSPLRVGTVTRGRHGGWVADFADGTSLAVDSVREGLHVLAEPSSRCWHDRIVSGCADIRRLADGLPDDSSFDETRRLAADIVTAAAEPSFYAASEIAQFARMVAAVEHGQRIAAAARTVSAAVAAAADGH